MILKSTRRFIPSPLNNSFGYNSRLSFSKPVALYCPASLSNSIRSYSTSLFSYDSYFRAPNGGVRQSSPTSGRHHHEVLADLDRFSISKVTTCLQRLLSSRSGQLAAVPKPVTSLNSTSSNPLWEAKLEFQITAKPGSEAFCAVGFASTSEKDAECACFMHAERILDCLGIPIFRLSSKQTAHATNARALGRFAPLPEAGMSPVGSASTSRRSINEIEDDAKKILPLWYLGGGNTGRKPDTTPTDMRPQHKKANLFESLSSASPSFDYEIREDKIDPSLFSGPVPPPAPPAPIHQGSAVGKKKLNKERDWILPRQLLSDLNSGPTGSLRLGTPERKRQSSPSSFSRTLIAEMKHISYRQTAPIPPGATILGEGVLVASQTAASNGSWNEVSLGKNDGEGLYFFNHLKTAIPNSCILCYESMGRIQQLFSFLGKGSLDDSMTLSTVEDPYTSTASSWRRNHYTKLTEDASQKWTLCRLSLKGLGSNTSNLVAEGRASTREIAEQLAAMHAELLLDQSGVPLFADDAKQQALHALECASVGRWATKFLNPEQIRDEFTNLRARNVISFATSSLPLVEWKSTREKKKQKSRTMSFAADHSGGRVSDNNSAVVLRRSQDALRTDSHQLLLDKSLLSQTPRYTISGLFLFGQKNHGGEEDKFSSAEADLLRWFKNQEGNLEGETSVRSALPFLITRRQNSAYSGGAESSLFRVLLQLPVEAERYGLRVAEGTGLTVEVARSLCVAHAVDILCQLKIRLFGDDDEKQRDFIEQRFANDMICGGDAYDGGATAANPPRLSAVISAWEPSLWSRYLPTNSLLKRLCARGTNQYCSSLNHSLLLALGLTTQTTMEASSSAEKFCGEMRQGLLEDRRKMHQEQEEAEIQLGFLEAPTVAPESSFAPSGREEWATMAHLIVISNSSTSENGTHHSTHSNKQILLAAGRCSLHERSRRSSPHVMAETAMWIHFLSRLVYLAKLPIEMPSLFTSTAVRGDFKRANEGEVEVVLKSIPSSFFEFAVALTRSKSPEGANSTPKVEVLEASSQLAHDFLNSLTASTNRERVMNYVVNTLRSRDSVVTDLALKAAVKV